MGSVDVARIVTTQRRRWKWPRGARGGTKSRFVRLSATASSAGPQRMPALHRSLPKFITYRHETAESEVNRRERRSCAALFTAEARREIRRRARHGRDARNGLAHIDPHTDRVSTWRPGVADQCGEPVFVPRSATADEGDGFAACMSAGCAPAPASERRRSRHHLATASGLQSAGRLQPSTELSAG